MIELSDRPLGQPRKAYTQECGACVGMLAAAEKRARDHNERLFRALAQWYVARQAARDQRAMACGAQHRHGRDEECSPLRHMAEAHELDDAGNDFMSEAEAEIVEKAKAQIDVREARHRLRTGCPVCGRMQA